MKQFKVTFIPHYTLTPSFLNIQASSKEQLIKDFRGGKIITIVEITEESYEEEK